MNCKKLAQCVRVQSLVDGEFGHPHVAEWRVSHCYGEIVKVSTDLSLLRDEGEPSRFTEDLGVVRCATTEYCGWRYLVEATSSTVRSLS